MKKVPKVVVIGLDAATWTVIRPWMAEGKMPNLAKLMKAGVSGTLESYSPADYSAGLDLVYDREESGQTRHLSLR